MPGTTYHYSIGGGPDYTFHAPPTSSFRFDAIGDVGDTVNFSKLGATLDNISADDPSFVLMVGDLTYANGTTHGGAVDQHFNDVMRLEHPGRVHARLGQPRVRRRGLGRPAQLQGPAAHAARRRLARVAGDLVPAATTGAGSTPARCGSSPTPSRGRARGATGSPRPAR